MALQPIAGVSSDGGPRQSITRYTSSRAPSAVTGLFQLIADNLRIFPISSGQKVSASLDIYTFVGSVSRPGWVDLQPDYFVAQTHLTKK